jgi:hypothetical protein
MFAVKEGNFVAHSAYPTNSADYKVPDASKSNSRRRERIHYSLLTLYPPVRVVFTTPYEG